MVQCLTRALYEACIGYPPVSYPSQTVLDVDGDHMCVCVCVFVWYVPLLWALTLSWMTRLGP